MSSTTSKHLNRERATEARDSKKSPPKIASLFPNTYIYKISHMKSCILTYLIGPGKRNLVDGRNASARYRFVYHIVMKEACSMDHLYDFSEALLQGENILCLALVRGLCIQRVRDCHNHGRPNLLSAIHLEEVPRTLLQDWVVATQQLLDSLRSSSSFNTQSELE